MMRRIVARRSWLATLPSAVKPTSCWRFIGCFSGARDLLTDRPRSYHPSRAGRYPNAPVTLPKRASHLQSGREGRAPRLRSWCPIPLVPERRGLATSKDGNREIAEAIRYVELAEKGPPHGAEHGR